MNPRDKIFAQIPPRTSKYTHFSLGSQLQGCPQDAMEPRLTGLSTSMQLCELGYLDIYFTLEVLLLWFPKLHSISFEKLITAKIAC